MNQVVSFVWNNEEYLSPSTACDVLLKHGESSAGVYGVLTRYARAGKIRTVATGKRSRGYHAGDVLALAKSREA
jgi:Fe2+ or Zn2+ uptake regulation protein